MQEAYRFKSSLVGFKAIISLSYTMKRKRYAHLIKCSKNGQCSFVTFLQSGSEKTNSEVAAVMHQNKPSAFPSPEQCM